jgi:ADP-ribose pyrophosphatase
MVQGGSDFVLLAGLEQSPTRAILTAVAGFINDFRIPTDLMADQTEELLVTRRFRVVRHVQTTSDGAVHVKETIQHPGAVAILPLLEGNRVCLIRNFRIAVGKTLIELPAGTLESGEDPATTAGRELIEETGYRAQRLEKLCEFTMSPGILNERMHLYAAHGLTAGPTAREPGETIENLVVTWDEAMRMVFDGDIEDAKTMVGLLYYNHAAGDRFRRMHEQKE